MKVSASEKALIDQIPFLLPYPWREIASPQFALHWENLPKRIRNSVDKIFNEGVCPYQWGSKAHDIYHILTSATNVPAIYIYGNSLKVENLPPIPQKALRAIELKAQIVNPKVQVKVHESFNGDYRVAVEGYGWRKTKRVGKLFSQDIINALYESSSYKPGDFVTPWNENK